MNPLEDNEKKIINVLVITATTNIIICGLLLCPSHGGVTSLMISLALFIFFATIFGFIMSIVTVVVSIFSLIKSKSRQTTLISLICLILVVLMQAAMIMELSRTP